MGEKECMKNRIDDVIVEGFKKGIEEDFNKIYKQYYKRIYFYAYQICYNTELAEDIVQNTFISAYQAKEKLQSNAAFHVWLMRIAHNEVLKAIKVENKKAANTSALLDIENMAAIDTKDALEEVKIQEVMEEIDSSIQSMKEKHKSVAVLHYYFEMTNEEIASALEIPKGTVKSRLYYVNKNIQQSLTDVELTPTLSHAIATLPILLAKFVDSTNIVIPHLSMRSILIGTTSTTVGTGIVRKAVKAKRLLLGGGVTVAIVTAALVINGNRLKDKSMEKPLVSVIKQEVKEESPLEEMGEGIPEPPIEYSQTPKIVSIEYDNEYTSLGVDLSVYVDSDAYDTIAVNGEEGTRIEENGVYTVQILCEGEVLDTAIVEITNIDRTLPTAEILETSDKEYAITFADLESGINVNSLRYYKNNQVSTEYQYNKDTHTFTFSYEDWSNNIIYIEDLAGNWTQVQIQGMEE